MRTIFGNFFAMVLSKVDKPVVCVTRDGHTHWVMDIQPYPI